MLALSFLNFTHHFMLGKALDRLVEHGTSALPESTRLVNPAWRTLDSQVRKTASELSRDRAKFSAEQNDLEKAAAHEVKKGIALAQIQTQQTRLTELKTQRKTQPKHIELRDLPEGQKVAQLRAGRKQFIDTIKLIAYRSESALVQVAREKLTRPDDARSLIRGLMQTAVNLRPDYERKELHIQLHGQTNPMQDAVVNHLCEELNATETHYPGTDLRMIYTPLRSSPFPVGQDV